jgi:hypothetical protein
VRATWPKERAVVAALIAIHLALVGWGMARNSVMFDENFHLPAGVAIVARRDFGVSLAQPPLIKSACALAALAAGARVPPPRAHLPNAEYQVGEDFERANADRYTRVYTAARLVIAALALLLALLVWRWARRLHGARGAALALAAYVLAPEAVAHAGIVGMDLPVALGCTAALYSFWRFARGGQWCWWGATALAVGLTVLTRFSAIQLGPALLALAALGSLTGRLRRPGRVWAGLALLPLTSLLALNAGYLGRTSFAPLSSWHFVSPSFQQLQRAWPGLRLPLPNACLLGLDYLSSMQAAGGTHTFLMGRISEHTWWYYVPFALAIKWPLGWLGLLAARGVLQAFHPSAARRAWHEAFLWIPALTFLLIAMFVARLDVGIRYLLPILPLLCVWVGGLAPHPARWRAAPRGATRRWAIAAALLVAIEATETSSAAPYDLSFFNALAGPHPDRLINDSNVDWGQGLIALRDELRRRGIARVHLAYHGTADPALYGIDYVPFLGGRPGPESDWLAVSSYYFVGLPQRMITPAGRTQQAVQLDFRALWGREPDAHPARCMYLFRLR